MLGAKHGGGMTVLQDVRDLVVRRSPNAICDDCIAAKLKITPRQHANHKTRELVDRRLTPDAARFDRSVKACGGCGKTKKAIRYA
jgi:hypothetical protein